jgi:SAM-dependent methyltransferase
MNRRYWEEKGRDYDAEIFDVYAEDRQGLLARWIRRLARPRGSAADLGCGTGKALPLLARHFSSVEAVDLSSSCVRVARESARDWPHVQVRRGDLARDRSRRQVDVVLCVNVLIMPDEATQAAVWRTLARALRPGGRALVVVPSLESALWSASRLYLWERKAGAPARAARRSAARFFPHPNSTGVLEGVIPIAGVPTRHHLAPELESRSAGLGLTLERLEKVEYGWHTEFENPPRWMQAPFPWDWLAVCRKPLISNS